MNNNNFIKAILGIMAIFFTFSAFSQATNSRFNDAIMPSTNASALGKYTDIPVSTFTGVPNISLPIFTIEEGPLSLPIALGYHASGLKPGEPVSWVGAGWSLSSGGIITRTILDIKDEKLSNGFLNNNISTGQCTLGSCFDTEPDIFSYNINGYSGKFVLRPKGPTPNDGAEIVFIEKTEVKGDVTFLISNNLIQQITGFILTDPAGTRYIFSDTDVETIGGDTEVDKTTWYLSKIETFDQKFSITLNYVTESYSYMSPASCGQEKASWGCGPGFSNGSSQTTSFCNGIGDGGPSGGGKKYHRIFVDGKRITSITNSSQTTNVTFSAGAIRKDLGQEISTGNPNAKCLDKIRVVTGGFCKEWKMQYSYFYDSGNYTAAERAATGLPSGTTDSEQRYKLKLDKVTEQSGADCSTASPEANQIVNPATVFEYYGSTTSYMDGTATVNTQFFPSVLTHAIDHWGFYNGQTGNNIVDVNAPINTLTSPGGVTITTPAVANREPDASTTDPVMIHGSIKKITYPTGGSTSFVFEPNTALTSNWSSPASTTLLSLNTCTTCASNACCGTKVAQSSITLTEEDISSAICEVFLTAIPSIPPVGTCASCSGNPSPSYLLEIFEGSSTTALFSLNFNMAATATGSTVLPFNLWEKATFKGGVSYTFKVTSVAGQGTLILKKPSLTVNKRVGGIRIKSITANDGISSSNDIIRTYTYTDANNSSNSSGRLFTIPQYGFAYSKVISSVEFIDFVKIAANAITPLGSYKGYHMGYQRVIESNNGNGQTVYLHYTESGEGRASNPILPPELPSLKNGQTYSTISLDASGNEVKKMVATPDSDVKFSAINFTKSVQKIYRLTNQSSGCNFSFTIPYSPVFSHYRTKSMQITLDGVNSSVSFDYDDATSTAVNKRINPRYVTTTNSNGQVLKTEKRYLRDYALNTATKTILTNFNLIGIAYEVNHYVNNALTSGTQVEFALVDAATGAWNTSGTIPRPRYFKNYEATFNTAGNATSGSYVTQSEIVEYHPNGLVKKSKDKGWADSDEYTWTNGLLTQVKFKNFTTNYEYFANSRLPASSTGIDGQQVWFDYDVLMRPLKVSARPSTANNKSTAKVSVEYQYKFKDASTPQNFVKTKTTLATVVAGSSISVIENFSYLDGLGRGIQTVQKQGSANSKDLISVLAYDNQGRISKSYIPFSNNATTGDYVANPSLTNLKFTAITYESSPLSRKTSITPPGWYASNLTYGTCIANEVRKNLTVSNDFYGANELFKSTVTNPNGNKYTRYIDRRGRLIMSRQSNTNGTSNADTYNIYDDKDRNTMVVPPGATITETNSLFTYTYDPADNLVMRKVPGAGAEKMVYDTRNLPVLYQDAGMAANLNASNQLTPRWLMTKYNDYGQVLSTGFYNSATQPVYSASLTYSETLTETFYDDITLKYKGRVKQAKTKILDDSATPKFLDYTYDYDSYGRVTSIVGNSHINLTAGSETTTFDSYDLADNLIQKTRSHKKTSASAALTIRDRFTYDHRGRSINTYHKIGTGTETLISNYVYNDRNFITQKNLGGTGTGYLQNVDFQYNTLGMLTGINSLCVNAAAAASAPPAAAKSIGLKINTIPNTWDAAATTKKTVFGIEISAKMDVNGIPQNLVKTTYLEASAMGTDSAAWKSMATLPSNISLSQQTTVDLTGMSLDQNADIAGFFLEVEKKTQNTLESLSFSKEKMAAIHNAVQGSLEQVLQPVLAAAAAPAVAAAAVATSSTDLFSMGLFYDLANTTLGAPAQKNGNISHIWSQVGCSNPQYYGFQYDYLDRMTAAVSAEYDIANSAYANLNRYNESLVYDIRGNITSTNRKGLTGTNTYGTIDNLLHVYDSANKNRISNTTEAGSTLKGFKTVNANGTQAYTYDENGNVKRDPHKSMTVKYFFHNFAKRIDLDNGTAISWVYDAAGNKLSKTSGSTGNNTTHYLGGIEYVGTATNFNIEAIYFGDGRCTPVAGGGWRYEYNLRDHLGNTRVTFSDLNKDGSVNTTEILQQHHHYPFGGNIEGLTSSNTPNKYQFNGTEWNADLGLERYDFGDRMYDPWVGRWWGIDPMASLHEGSTPYHYVFNNPVRYMDYMGRDTVADPEVILSTVDIVAEKGQSQKEEKGTSLTWSTQPIQTFSSSFTAGVLAAIRENFTYMPRPKPQSSDELLGQRLGDGLCVIMGIVETMAGEAITAAAVAGEVVSAGGATPLAIPLAALGQAIAAHGMGTANVAVVNSFRHMNDKVESHSGGATSKVPDLPSIDATGKVHGTLPKVEDFGKYTKDELQVLLTELNQSVKERIRITTIKGRDRGHGQRQGAEHDLIKSLEKYLSK